MRLMKTIRFRPKPEFMDRFLDDYNKITEKALLKGTIDSYFTAVIEDEIVYVGIFNTLHANSLKKLDEFS